MRLALSIGVLVFAPLVAIAACGGELEPMPGDSTQQRSVAAEEEGREPGGETPAASRPKDECSADSPHGECLAEGSSSGAVRGERWCFRNGEGVMRWTDCIAKESPAPPEGSSSTPLVLVFDGARVEFSATPGGSFDLAGDGASHATDWPTARTPWLAFDRDGNGRIDDGSELFGSMTRLATGLRARHGFEALAELDSNHDGAITADDEAFARLVLWADADGDRIARDGEQPTAASEGIVRIDLAYHTASPHCTARGNCEIERATFVYRDATGALRTGEVVDVHLRHH